MTVFAGRYSEDLQDRYGNGFRNATVAVQTLIGGAVALYSDRAKTAYVPASGLSANEIKADDKGNLRFFADPGNYQIVVTPSGGSALTAFPISVLPDPLEPLDLDIVDVESAPYLADPTGVVDSMAAIVAAEEAARMANLPLYLRAGAVFRVESPIQFGCEVLGHGATIEYYGQATDTAVTLRLGTTTARLTRKTLYLPEIVNKTKPAGQTNWNTDTGLKIWNCSRCEIHVPYVRDFSVGLHMIASDNQGCVYNSVTIGQIFNCKTEVWIRPNADGWVNENRYYNAQLTIPSGATMPIPGTRQIVIEVLPDSIYSGPNANNFYQPTLENSGTCEVTAEFIGASTNQIMAPRLERDSGTAIFRFRGYEARQCENNIVLFPTSVASLRVESLEFASKNSVLSNAIGMLDGPSSTPAGFPSRGVRSTSSSSAPLDATYHPSSDIWGAPGTSWTRRITALAWESKTYTDAAAKFDILFSTGRQRWFDSAGVAKAQLQRESTGLRFSDPSASGKNLEIANGTWNGEHFVLGSIHVWATAAGALRVKSGAPTSEGDGASLTLGA